MILEKKTLCSKKFLDILSWLPTWQWAWSIEDRDKNKSRKKNGLDWGGGRSREAYKQQELVNVK